LSILTCSEDFRLHEKLLGLPFLSYSFSSLANFLVVVVCFIYVIAQLYLWNWYLPHLQKMPFGKVSAFLKVKSTPWILSLACISFLLKSVYTVAVIAGPQCGGAREPRPWFFEKFYRDSDPHVTHAGPFICKILFDILLVVGDLKHIIGNWFLVLVTVLESSLLICSAMKWEPVHTFAFWISVLWFTITFVSCAFSFWHWLEIRYTVFHYLLD
jgi:hypothetical protein